MPKAYNSNNLSVLLQCHVIKDYFNPAISITKPLVVIEKIGSTVTLECTLKTDSSTTLTWKKDDTTNITGVSTFKTDTSTFSS